MPSEPRELPPCAAAVRACAARANLLRETQQRRTGETHREGERCGHGDVFGDDDFQAGVQYVILAPLYASLVPQGARNTHTHTLTHTHAYAETDVATHFGEASFAFAFVVCE